MDGFCGLCGRPLAEGDHAVCRHRLLLEPPRYCASCRRRLKVQVTPRGWSATCVEHGETTSQGSTTAP
jgi:hypothetical protein